MSCYLFKTEYLKQVTIFFSCLCFLFSSCAPTPLFADVCIYANEDELENRTKTAYVVAGLTVVALAGGIACLASASGNHRHHTSSSGSSYYSYSPYYHYSYDSNDYSYDRSHHHRHDYYRSKDYSDYGTSGGTSYSDSNYNFRQIAPQINPRFSNEEHSQEEDYLISGLFVSSQDLAQGQGNLSVFVQLPDGSTRSLGSLPVSGNRGATLSFGPFNQKGTYLFGVNLDQGFGSSVQTKIGSLEINVNGSKKQRHEFIAPPHAPANYEPLPCCFDLN